MAENEITGYAASRLRKDAQVAEAGELVDQNTGGETIFEVPESYDFPEVEDEAAAVENYRAEVAAEHAEEPQVPGDVPDPDNPNIPEFNQ